jgi:hypothetical protein
MAAFLAFRMQLFQRTLERNQVYLSSVAGSHALIGSTLKYWRKHLYSMSGSIQWLHGFCIGPNSLL